MTGLATSDYEMLSMIERLLDRAECEAASGRQVEEWRLLARRYFDLVQDVFLACPSNESAELLAAASAAFQRALQGRPQASMLSPA